MHKVYEEYVEMMIGESNPIFLDTLMNGFIDLLKTTQGAERIPSGIQCLANVENINYENCQ